MLRQLLETKMKEEGLSTRQAAIQITKVSHTTIVRALKGVVVDLETLKKISKWLGVLPSTLLNSESNTKDALASEIAIVLEQEPELERVFRNAIHQVLKEKVDPAVIKEIAAYAAFRLSLEKPNKD